MKEYKPYKVIIQPYGEKNSPIARDLQALCYMSVKKLKKSLVDFLIKKEYDVEFGNDYIYARCETSKEKEIMLTAHMDTVQNPRGAGVIYVSKCNDKHYLWSPNGIGGDDRCGVLAIKRIIEKGYRPTILFCDKEESGGAGSEEFSEKYAGKIDLNCIIELDRQGSKDLVFYDEDNEEWQKFLVELTGWKKARGSFSDICKLYDLGCASVNLSVGYYHQHTKDEYIILEELENSISITEKIINSVHKKWEHIENRVGFYDENYYFMSGRCNRYWEYSDYEIVYKDKNGNIDTEIMSAYSEKQAMKDAELYYDISKEDIIAVYCLNSEKDDIYELEKR